MSARALRLALAALVLCAGCATGPEVKPTSDAAPPDAGEAAPAADAGEQTDGAATTPPAGNGESGGTTAAAADGGSATPVEPPEPVPVTTYDPAVQQDFARAARAAEAGDATGAESALKEALDREPRADFAWTNLGMLQERADTAKAEASYRKALSLSLDQEQAWDGLGRLLCRTGRCDAFIAEARARTQRKPRAPGPRNALALALVQVGKLEDAATEAKTVLKDEERNVRAMQVLAQVFFLQSKWELARMVLERARLIDPRNAATHNALGLVQLQFKTIQRAQALESFATAVRLKPDFAEALSNHGAMLVEAEDYETAITELERAVGLAPDFSQAHMNLGNAYRGAGKAEQAQAQYQAVLKLQPKNADPWFNLAILYLDADFPNVDTLQRYETCLQHFAAFAQAGGKDERVDLYVKDAKKAIEKEKRRRERAEKDRLKKAEKDAKDAAKKAADEAAAKKAAEEAAKKAAEEAARNPPPAPPPAPAQGGKLGDEQDGAAPPPAPAPAPAAKLGDEEGTR